MGERTKTSCLVFLLIRAPILSDQGLTLITSFTRIISAKALSPNTLGG